MAQDTPDDVESYQDKLSEQVDDSGGCVENWTALTEMRGNSPDRRTVMRGLLGVLGGILGSGVATAKSGAENTKVRIETQSGRQREQTLSRVSRGGAYDTLIQAMKVDGYSGSITEENVYSVKPRLEGSYTLVSFVMEFGSEATGNIAISPDSTLEPRAGVFVRDDSGRPLTIEEYRLDDTFSTVSEIPEDVPLSLSTRELSVGDSTVVKKKADLRDMWSELDRTTSSTSSYCDDFPDEIDCGTCKEIVSILNEVTCSIETLAACAIITSETGIGPIVCAVAVAVLCYIIQNYGIANPQQVCEAACACT